MNGVLATVYLHADVRLPLVLLEDDIKKPMAQFTFETNDNPVPAGIGFSKRRQVRANVRIWLAAVTAYKLPYAPRVCVVAAARAAENSLLIKSRWYCLQIHKSFLFCRGGGCGCGPFDAGPVRGRVFFPQYYKVPKVAESPYLSTNAGLVLLMQNPNPEKLSPISRDMTLIFHPKRPVGRLPTGNRRKKESIRRNRRDQFEKNCAAFIRDYCEEHARAPNGPKPISKCTHGVYLPAQPDPPIGEKGSPDRHAVICSL
jgi:hypothetical protein